MGCNTQELPFRDSIPDGTEQSCQMTHSRIVSSTLGLEGSYHANPITDGNRREVAFHFHELTRVDQLPAASSLTAALSP